MLRYIPHRTRSIISKLDADQCRVLILTCQGSIKPSIKVRFTKYGLIYNIYGGGTLLICVPFRISVMLCDFIYRAAKEWNWACLGRRKEDDNPLKKGRDNLYTVPIPADTLMTGDGTEAEGDWWRRAYLFTDSWYSGLGNRHNSGKNIQVSWVDGHSSSMSKTTLSVDGKQNYYFLIEKPE